jgi:Na+-transporting methylmalonyl-CoA/oxaloacetate decarboxylase gamma subunit
MEDRMSQFTSSQIRQALSELDSLAAPMQQQWQQHIAFARQYAGVLTPAEGSTLSTAIQNEGAALNKITEIRSYIQALTPASVQGLGVAPLVIAGLALVIAAIGMTAALTWAIGSFREASANAERVKADASARNALTQQAQQTGNPALWSAVANIQQQQAKADANKNGNNDIPWGTVAAVGVGGLAVVTLLFRR